MSLPLKSQIMAINPADRVGRLSIPPDITIKGYKHQIDEACDAILESRQYWRVIDLVLGSLPVGVLFQDYKKGHPAKMVLANGQLPEWELQKLLIQPRSNPKSKPKPAKVQKGGKDTNGKAKDVVYKFDDVFRARLVPQTKKSSITAFASDIDQVSTELRKVTQANTRDMSQKLESVLMNFKKRKTQMVSLAADQHSLNIVNSEFMMGDIKAITTLLHEDFYYDFKNRLPYFEVLLDKMPAVLPPIKLPVLHLDALLVH
ncbi:unnamed protein product [Ambrosiozyma monospora]|uniref:Unnamed protein product n=1 Tax=Ambrosiozyma monospora TaxID=43982 RepID=A0ACB5THC3_AMBMO|nr:unnamed protein product [Ambrosiozyma monospora]